MLTTYLVDFIILSRTKAFTSSVIPRNSLMKQNLLAAKSINLVRNIIASLFIVKFSIGLNRVLAYFLKIYIFLSVQLLESIFGGKTYV